MNEFMKKAIDLLGEYGEIDQPISADTQLIADLGLNSLELMEIITDIEEKNNIVISDDELKSIITVGDIAELIKVKGI